MNYRMSINKLAQTFEKLLAKKEECEKLQEKMKLVNIYYKQNGTCVGHPELTKEPAYELEVAMFRRYWDSKPYPTYALSNNEAEICRLRKQIDEITCAQSGGNLRTKKRVVERDGEAR